jgi:GTPase SAR1 family protein
MFFMVHAHSSCLQWFQWGDGFLLLFSLTSRESFEDVIVLHAELIKARSNGIPKILVGTKGNTSLHRVTDVCSG